MVYCHYYLSSSGIVFGVLNAVLINKFRIQSFIATLAVGSFIAQGVSLIVSGGRPINFDDPVIVWSETYKIAEIVPITVVIFSGSDFDLRRYPCQNEVRAQYLPERRRQAGSAISGSQS
jgi:ABC-type xylose transport system permease subunit